MCIIQGTDEAGNVWSLKMAARFNKSNRFELIFSVNEKQFCISKIATHKQANCIWEGLCKVFTSQTKIDSQSLIKKQKEISCDEQNCD